MRKQEMMKIYHFIQRRFIFAQKDNIPIFNRNDKKISKILHNAEKHIKEMIQSLTDKRFDIECKLDDWDCLLLRSYLVPAENADKIEISTILEKFDGTPGPTKGKFLEVDDVGVLKCLRRNKIGTIMMESYKQIASIQEYEYLLLTPGGYTSSEYNNNQVMKYLDLSYTFASDDISNEDRIAFYKHCGFDRLNDNTEDDDPPILICSLIGKPL